MLENSKMLFSPADIPPGMLSSPQILQCLRAGLLVRDWNASCLLPATYDMRLGAFACWYIGGVRQDWHMGERQDQNAGVHTSIVLKPNSMSFVSTIEEFLLPCDIIARFNLRSHWVRKGLLLGTAPIVEPQFSGRLLIPIHNFSSYPVQVDYGAPFIAVEFTKTLPVDSRYVQNQDSLGNIKKYIERSGVVESSVSAAISRNQKLYDSIESKMKFFSIASAITLFLLISGVMTLIINIFNLADNTRKAALQAESTIKTFSAKNYEDFKKIDKKMLDMEFMINKLKEELAEKNRP